jgi:hypothetical protein
MPGKFQVMQTLRCNSGLVGLLCEAFENLGNGRGVFDATGQAVLVIDERVQSLL